MSVLRTIESKIEGLFEGVFGRAFRTHVQPVELARKLAKEMDEHRSVSVSRVYVPNEYTIYLSSLDRQQFTSYEGSLIGELQEYLTEHARREAYALLTPPRVKFATDDDLAVGEFGIATRVAQPEDGLPPLPTPKPAPPAPVQSVSIPVAPPTAPVEAPAAVATTMVYRQVEPTEPESATGTRDAPRGRDADARRARAPCHSRGRRDRSIAGMRRPRGRRQRLATPRRGGSRTAVPTSSSTSDRRTERS